MKNSLKQLVILLFICSNTYAQISFKAEYKLILAKNGYAPIYYDLINLDNTSIFKFVKKELPEKVVNNEATGEVTLNPETPDSIQPLILSDHNMNEIISREYISFDDGETYKRFNVIESADVKWTLRNETKKIDKHTCKMATTSFRGRNYIAWYSEDIPVPIGPWKFHGLPGLIIEITDATKEVSFLLTNIKHPFTGSIEATIDNMGDLISAKDFFKIKEKAKADSREAFKNKTLSRLPRGATIELTKAGNNDIEIEYSGI